MDQLDHVTSVIGIVVCKVIQKSITKNGFSVTNRHTQKSKEDMYDWYRKSIIVISFWITLQTVIAITDVHSLADS